MPGGNDAAQDKNARDEELRHAKAPEMSRSSGALFQEHPRLLLAACGIVGFMALIGVMSDVAASFPRLLPFFGAGLIAIFCAAYLVALSLALAVCAAAGVAMAVIWALGFVAALGVAFSYAVLAAIIVMAGIVAIGIGHQIHSAALEMARGTGAVAASHKAIRDWARPLVAGAAVSLPGLVAMPPYPRGPWLDVLLAGVAFLLALFPIVYVMVPCVASRIATDENFFAHGNRVRERRENFAAWLGLSAAPPWSGALVGVAFALFLLPLFDAAGRVGAGFPSASSGAAPPWAVAVCTSGAICALACRDLRAFFTCTIPPFALAIAAIWISVYAGVAGPETLAQIFLAGGSAGVGVALLLMKAIASRRVQGDDIGAAYGSAVNDSGIVIFIVGAMLFLAAAAFATEFDAGLAAAIMVPALLIAVLAFVPAFAVIFERVFPRRISTDA